MSSIKSTYDLTLYDRNWSFQCKKVANHFDYCYWTDYLNQLDQALHAQCEPGNFITGIQSYHVDGYNDRRFRIRCCRSDRIKLKECKLTAVINNYRAYMDYEVSDGYIMQKLESIHNNIEE